MEFMQGNKAEVVRHDWNKLHCAARDGQVEVVKRILHDVLCGVDDRTPINETALHKAVRGNRLEICKILLLQGADPNLKNKGGRTPLYFVLDPEVTEVLLQAGADTNITDKWEDKTPLEFIKEQRLDKPQLEAVINIIESWTDNQTPLEVKHRGEETVLAYKTAIRHGTKPLHHLRFMLVGPERVGKTSLKKALLGYEFNDKEEKTDGIESSTTVRVDIEEISNWEKDINAPGYNLSHVLAKQTADVLKNKSTSTAGVTQAGGAVTPSTSPPADLPDSALPSPPPSPPSPSTDLSSPHSPVGKVESADEDGEDDTLPKDVKRLVNTYMKWSDESLEEKCKLLFSVWDFAGHHLYYTMHQVFLSPRSIYCVVFDASKDLHAMADMDFMPVNLYQGIDQEFTKNHEMTNLEFLNFWISSIFTHVPENPQKDGDYLLSPPVFIVGTHLDLISGTDEEIKRKLEEIRTTIKDYLEDKAYLGHVVPEIYFVDNSRRPVGENMTKFKEHVEEVMRKQPYMDDSIPIAWFRFQCHVMELRKLNRKYVTLKQAKEDAMRLGIQDDQELFAMLQLFHDVGIIAFYGKNNGSGGRLGDIVVLNPQWLLGVFTTVITITKREEKWTKYKWCWRILEEKGILEETLISHVWKDFTEDQRESLLQIMERFDLLCENKVKRDETDALCTVDSGFRRQFFVPCQLMIPSKEDHVRVWELELNAVVINIIPKDGFLPEGLFHRLSVRAVTWTQQRQDCQSEPPHLFYRQTYLYLDEDHELIFRMHTTKMGKRMIKVIIYFPSVVGVDGSRSPTPSVCKQVLIFIENSMNDLKTMWMRNMTLGVFVPCYMCREYDGHHHDLYNCLTSGKVRCGKERSLTKFWQTLFGDDQLEQEVCHPLKSLKSTNDVQPNGILPAPDTALVSSSPPSPPELGTVEVKQVSTSGLITELAPDVLDPVNSIPPAITHGNGTRVTVAGDHNMVFVNSQVNINIDRRSIFSHSYAILVAICALFAMMFIALVGTYH